MPFTCNNVRRYGEDVRDATFVSLSKWLGAKATIDVLDMKKIWKGLFYAMWHADGYGGGTYTFQRALFISTHVILFGVPRTRFC